MRKLTTALIWRGFGFANCASHIQEASPDAEIKVSTLVLLMYIRSLIILLQPGLKRSGNWRNEVGIGIVASFQHATYFM